MEILSADPYLPEIRLQAIGRGIDMNIDGFRRHVDRMARLFPLNAPPWMGPASFVIPECDGVSDGMPSAQRQPYDAAADCPKRRRPHR